MIIRLFLLLLCLALTACGSPLRGKVILGDYSMVTVTGADDPEWIDHLATGGIPGATIHLQMDPGTLRAKTLARATTGPDGSFVLDIREPGAGILQHDVGLYVRALGFAPAQTRFTLPGSQARLLIVMTPGRDRALEDESEDIEGQIERHLR